MTTPALPSGPIGTIQAQRPVKYRDFDMAFRRNPITNDLMVKDEDGSIKQSIKNLVLTSFYESPKEVGRGTNVNSSLFENYTWELEYLMRRAIARAIIIGEPRVKLIDVIAGTDQDGTVRVKVSYIIVGIVGQRTLDLVFERVR